MAELMEYSVILVNLFNLSRNREFLILLIFYYFMCSRVLVRPSKLWNTFNVRIEIYQLYTLSYYSTLLYYSTQQAFTNEKSPNKEKEVVKRPWSLQGQRRGRMVLALGIHETVNCALGK